MSRFDGSLARTLDFGEATAASGAMDAPGRMGARPSLSRARGAAVVFSGRIGLLRGTDKYKVLDRRRRAAQIQARHAMDLIEVMERAAERGR